MGKNSVFKSFLLGLTLLTSLAGMIPANSYAEGGQSLSNSVEPRNAVGVILMSGLMGGILGLSTLSFYKRPQDNIRNITIGAGLGMITAAIYMTYTVSQSAVSTKTSRLEWAPAIGDHEAGMVASLHF